MNIVLDTNVLIAAVITRGFCTELFEHCVQFHTLFTSDFIIDEFQEKMKNKFQFSRRDVHESKNLLFSRMTKMIPKNISDLNLRDTDDLIIVGTAQAARAHFLITGDRELLDLCEYKGIEIISPREFWQREE